MGGLEGNRVALLLALGLSVSCAGHANDDGSGGSLPSGASLSALAWRNSRESFCQDDAPAGYDPPSVSLWSDERGVFLLVGERFSTVYLNAGDGWQLYNRRVAVPNESSRLTGFPSGNLLRYGSASPYDPAHPRCGIEVIQPSGVTCSSSATDSASGLSVVDADVAYSYLGSQVFRYSSGQWQPFGDTVSLGCGVIRSMWASRESVSLGFNYAKSAQISAANYEDRQVNTAGADFDFSCAWGFGDQFLFGTSRGSVVQGTSGSWSAIANTQSSCATYINGMWGGPDALYFWTTKSVSVLRDGRVDTVLALPCGGTSSIESVWGNSAREVFVAARDARLVGNRCGDVRVYWYNGDVLSPL
ncbi:MAG: hypothetical protein QM756_28510 [Polyangiaceae bacterium]